MPTKPLKWELAEWQPGMPTCWHLKNGGPYPIGSIIELGGVTNRTYECRAYEDGIVVSLGIAQTFEEAKLSVEVWNAIEIGEAA